VGARTIGPARRRGRRSQARRDRPPRQPHERPECRDSSHDLPPGRVRRLRSSGCQGDAQQVPLVMKLLEPGYADNLLFSSDLATLAQTKKGGGTGYAKTLTVFVPKLRSAGASDEVLRQIMQDNPRRFL